MFPDTVSQTLHSDVVAQAQTLSAEDRQMLVISYVPKAKEIWLVQGEEGVVMLEDKGETRLPVFPHKDLAQVWIDEKQISSSAMAVSFEDFTQTWLPGLSKNGIELVMFPSASDLQDLVMTAEDLLAEFNAAMN